ncbi:hypothetical protein J4G33_09395 [Actinotalea sp. BY-33]|uniref:Uncharacterized protein n=2 Tax=Actinotalea soli TaxID=2819234 RepID=A0A939LS22_9CELL|nr:hypothetical protein [Actinotalea soli]
MAGLWIAYLVPHRLRYRQQLLESRADDRYSERLRVLRVAQATRAGATVTASAGRSPFPLHSTARAARGGGGPMDRPHATTDRISADAARRSAAEHAQRAAHLARRSAAARRRALLCAALLLLAVGGWALVGAAGAAVLAGAVPTALLATVLGLGRRAVIAGARADAAWEAGAATRAPVAVDSAARQPARRTTGRAVHPSEASTEVMARVPRESVTSARTDRSSTGAGTVSAGAVQGRVAEASEAPDRTAAQARSEARSAETETWAPVPVPRPSYTFKAAAPRREPAPLVLDDVALTAVGQLAADAPSADEGHGASGRPEESTPSAAPATASSTGPARSLDLDAILARRRASGE